MITLPPGKKIIGYKWVFIVKLNSDGSLAHLKTRLVAKRYSHVYGVDYVNTFSNCEDDICVNPCVISGDIPLALHQLDVKNVILNCILDEEIYMEQPPDFVAQRACAKVCRLKNSLYSLK